MTSTYHGWDESIPLDTLIASAPFLTGVPPVELDHLFRVGARGRFVAQGEFLFKQGDPLRHIYILFDGTIQEEHRPRDAQAATGTILNRTSTKGAMIGHYDLLFRKPHSTYAYARTDSQALEIDVSAMQRLLHRYPDIAQQMAPMARINRLRTIPLAGKLDVTTLSFLAEAGEVQELAAGETLYEGSEQIDRFFLIDQGQVALEWPDGDRLLVSNGMALGFEDSDETRAGGERVWLRHSARTTTDSRVFAISRDRYRAITGSLPDTDARRLRADSVQALRQVTVFQKFDDQTIATLHGHCSLCYLPVHHVLMQQGEVADSMWILLPGSEATLHALNEKQQALPSVPLSGLSYFGELALVAEIPMNVTIEARPGSQWLRINRADYRIFRQKYGLGQDTPLLLSPEARELLREEETRQRYSWLAEGEILIRFQRRHWIELLRKTIPAIVACMIILVLIVLSFFIRQDNLVFQCLYGGLTALAVGWLIWGILDYLNDYLLVTNQRVVRQEKVILFNETQQVAFLEQIQNVDFATSFFGNLLNYGAIQIQTAGTEGKIVFDYVPEPATMKTVILAQQGLRKRHYMASSRYVIQRILEDRFGLRPYLPEVVHQGSADYEAHTPDQGSMARVRSWLEPRMRKNLQDHIIWRKHVIVLLPKIGGPVAVILLAIVIALGPGWFPLSTLIAGIAVELIAAFIGLFGLMWAAWVVADWRNDTYEVTLTEIIDVEKKPLFFEEVRRTGRLGQIENIDVSLPSPLHFILNYGNVLLQTAATDGNFTFTAVSDPRGVAEELRRRIELYRRREEEQRAEDRAQELPDWFEGYNRLQTDIVRDPADWRR